MRGNTSARVVSFWEEGTSGKELSQGHPTRVIEVLHLNLTQLGEGGKGHLSCVVREYHVLAGEEEASTPCAGSNGKPTCSAALGIFHLRLAILYIW